MLNILLFLLAFVLMEAVAWSNHKYLMHGFLWSWHKDHHRKDHQQQLSEQLEDQRFEKNDRFFLVYALPAIALMIAGLSFQLYALVYISAGITLYGAVYFVVHDIVIHKRFEIPFLMKNHNAYTRAIIRAHRAHHWPKNKNDFHNYGLLLFSFRYFKS
jgi:beta-carotene 3-hydroxylase